MTKSNTLADLLTSITELLRIDGGSPFAVKYLHVEFAEDGSIKVLNGEFRFAKDGSYRQVRVISLGKELTVSELRPYGFAHEFVPGRPLLRNLSDRSIGEMYSQLASPQTMVVRLVQALECTVTITGLQAAANNPSVQVPQAGSQLSIPCGPGTGLR